MNTFILPVYNIIKKTIKNYRDNVHINLDSSKNSLDPSCSIIKNSKIYCTGNQNIIIIKKSILKNINITISGNNNAIIIHNNVNLANSTIRITGDNHKLEIESGCRFLNTSFWFEDSDNYIGIGKGTTCEGAHIAVTETSNTITIGEDCMLAFGIDLRNGDSHVIIDQNTGLRINPAGNIKIGNHVWIGAYVQIIKNTIIGDGSVIGIRSLISKNVPNNCIIAGNPSRILKNDIQWERDRSPYQKNK